MHGSSEKSDWNEINLVDNDENSIKLNQNKENNIEQLIENFNYTTSDSVLCEQPPPYSQLTVSIFPIMKYYEKDSMIIKQQNLLIISTILYTLWGLFAFIISIFLGIISSTIFYFSLWSACLILNGFINILSVILNKSSNEYNHFKRMFRFTLFINTIGFLIAAVGSNYKLSTLCLYSFNLSYKNISTEYFPWIFIFIFILTTIHNIFNIFMIEKIENARKFTFII